MIYSELDPVVLLIGNVSQWKGRKSTFNELHMVAKIFLKNRSTTVSQTVGFHV